ncbi:hypothetical protein NYA28ABAC_01683 [Salinicola sp. NYA28a]
MRNQRRDHDHNKWAFYSNAEFLLSIEIIRKTASYRAWRTKFTHR